MNPTKLRQHYLQHRDEIESRLSEFQALRNASDERLFKELVFVILTSQSSAEDSWSAANKLDELGLLTEPQKNEIGKVLEQHGISFENRKAEYIAENFNFLSQPTFSEPGKDLKIQSRINPENPGKTREWIAENIKGLSWKGASHFMRNIGYGDRFAILSKHTLAVMMDLGLIKSVDPPSNKEEYLEIEGKMQDLAEELEINIQALDLVLWSYRTGKIFK